MVRGFTKVRNEAHIIESTLDKWADICPDGIHVYDDCSTDATAEICREHPGVVEVISSDLMDPDRPRAEFFNRQTVFWSARRFLQDGDWVACFDADEHPYGFRSDLLNDPDCSVIDMDWYDVYITPEDEDKHFLEREWVGPEKRTIAFMFRLDRYLMGYAKPDQRIPFHNPEHQHFHGGYIKHFGKGISVDHWEAKCQYYVDTFPMYADKWESRKGKAVHTESDEGNPLIRFETVCR